MANYADATRTPRTLTDREQRALLKVTGEHRAGYRDHMLYAMPLGTGLREPGTPRRARRARATPLGRTDARSRCPMGAHAVHASEHLCCALRERRVEILLSERRVAACQQVSGCFLSTSSNPVRVTFLEAPVGIRRPGLLAFVTRTRALPYSARLPRGSRARLSQRAISRNHRPGTDADHGTTGDR